MIDYVMAWLVAGLVTFLLCSMVAGIPSNPLILVVIICWPAFAADLIIGFTKGICNRIRSARR